MKAKLIVPISMALFLTTAIGWSQQTNFFNDTFSNGSTTNQTSPAAPSTNSANYVLISSKGWSPTPVLTPNLFRYGIASSSSGVIEAQAIFTTNPVALVQAGDYVQLVVTFTNNNGLLVQSAAMGFGLYNSFGVPPIAGGMNGTATSSTSSSGGAFLWQGYVGQLSYTNGASRIMTRAPQTAGTTANDQDLVTSGSGSSSYSNPGAATIGSTTNSPLAFTNGQVLTEVLSVSYQTATSVNITNTIYPGPNTNGTALTQFGATATNTTYFGNIFDAFAIGWRATGTNVGGTVIDISQINVSGHETIVNGPPLITTQPTPLTVATNGYGEFNVVVAGVNPEFQWYRNGAPLANGPDVTNQSTETSSTLVISPAMAADAASGANGYYCKVTGQGGFFTYTTTNSLTLVAVTNLTWTPPSNNGNWDVDTTPNWVDPNTVVSVFTGGDTVLFTDANSPANRNVTLIGHLGPSAMTVLTASEFTIAGSGSIAGPGTVTYDGNGGNGSGEVILNCNNTYTGATFVTNGIYVDLENYNAFGTGPLNLNNPEPNSQIEVVQNGSGSLGFPGQVNVNDDATFLLDNEGSFGLVFLSNLSGTTGKTLTISPNPNTAINPDTNQIRIRAFGSSTVYNGNLALSDANIMFASYQASGSQTYNGVISGPGGFMEKGTITFLNGQSTYTGGTFPAAGTIGVGISSSGTWPSLTYSPLGNGPIYLNPDSTTSLTGNGIILASVNNLTIGNAIEYPSGTNNLSLEIGGTNNLTFSGPFTLNGNDGIVTNSFTSRTVQVTNTALSTLSGVISDGGKAYGFTLTGSGVLALNNTETYTGPTVAGGGRLLINGSITGIASATNGGLLGGTGSIGGAVTIQKGGGISPGGVSIGTLTINNSLTIQGGSTNYVRVNKTGSTHDLVVASSATYAGTLFATNLSGAITTSDTFQVFNISGAIAGNFTNVIGSPGPGLAWTFTPGSGLLGVTTAAYTVPPHISTITITNGTDLVLTGTNAQAGNPYYLLTSTNAQLPLSQWTPVGTNIAPGANTFTFTISNSVTPNSPRQFYLFSNKP